MLLRSSSYCQVQALQDNLSTYRRELSGCFHTLPVVSGDRLCTVLPLVGEILPLLLFRSVSQRSFRHELPCHSSKHWSFPTHLFLRLIFFVSLSLSSLLS